MLWLEYFEYLQAKLSDLPPAVEFRKLLYQTVWTHKEQSDKGPYFFLVSKK